MQVQSDVTIMGTASSRTLHIKTLRRQWQIITLQIIATAALVGMYFQVVSTYVVGSIDHTMLFASIESLIGDDLPLGDWFTGEGRTGLARFFRTVSNRFICWRSNGVNCLPNPQDATEN